MPIDACRSRINDYIPGFAIINMSMKKTFEYYSSLLLAVYATVRVSSLITDHRKQPGELSTW